MKKLLFLFAVLMCGCMEDFSPNGEYKQRLIVYGVMDGNSSTQLIRVSSTYSPDLYDPLKPAPNTELANASVRVKEGNTIYTFHDTVITVSGTSGNRSVHAYVHYALQPLASKTYSLSVASPGGYDTVTSSFNGLSDGEIQVNSFLFTKPGTEKSIPIRIATGLNAIAYLLTVSLEFRVGNESTVRVRETPISVIKNAAGEITKKNYPFLIYRNSSTVALSSYETVNYETAAYLSTVAEIKNEFGSSVKFNRVIVSMKQFDTNLYTYYSITNSFGSTATLRLDEPDYSNIVNGFGVFGMTNSLDRSYSLPADF